MDPLPFCPGLPSARLSRRLISSCIFMHRLPSKSLSFWITALSCFQSQNLFQASALHTPELCSIGVRLTSGGRRSTNLHGQFCNLWQLASQRPTYPGILSRPPGSSHIRNFPTFLQKSFCFFSLACRSSTPSLLFCNRSARMRERGLFSLLFLSL